MELFFGQAENIQFIEVNPDETSVLGGRVRTPAIDEVTALFMYAAQNRNVPLARACAQVNIMRSMAGASAANRVETKPRKNWFAHEFNNWSVEPMFHSDIGHSLMFANPVVALGPGDVQPSIIGPQLLLFEHPLVPVPISSDDASDEAIKLLRQCCRWVDEAFSDARLWNVVEVLAAKLMRKHHLSGHEALDIMWTALGKKPLVWAEKWRRRFRLLRYPFPDVSAPPVPRQLGN